MAINTGTAGVSVRVAGVNTMQKNSRLRVKFSRVKFLRVKFSRVKFSRVKFSRYDPNPRKPRKF